MINVTFVNWEEIDNDLFKYAVIAARYKGKWIFCRRKERTTWEIPGGHRELGEDINETAKRELHEETGAYDFEIQPVAAYCVCNKTETTYGMLFYANIKSLDELGSDTEIAQLMLDDKLPDNLTYPNIQPCLFNHVLDFLREKI